MGLHATGRSLPAVFLLGCAASSRNAFDVTPAHTAVAEASARPDEGRDAAALRAPALERTAFIRAVLDRNRSVEAARQAWRGAAARVHESGAFDDPTVTADVAPLSIGVSRVRFGWDAMISQRVPWPGKLSLDVGIARFEADAARSDFESIQREIALTASELFDRYFVSARSIEVNAHHVDLMRRMRAAAVAQYEAGRGSAQDSLQAEFELTHMEHDAILLASQQDVIVAQMNELLHRAPDLPLPPPPADLPAPRLPDVLDAHRLEAEALDHRPDIDAARQHERSAEARVERARRESFPDVSVQTGYSSLWDAPELRWTVGLSVNLPLQTGRRAGAVDEAEAMRAQYEADAARLSDSVRTEIVVALKQLEESRHVLRLYEDRLVPVARSEVDAARAAFTASQAPFVAVIDAERNLRSVELEEQTARADCDRRAAELDRALGRIPGLDGAEVTP